MFNQLMYRLSQFLIFAFLLSIAYSQPPPRVVPPPGPPRPGVARPGWVWVAGHWEGVGRSRRWIPGHWERAPVPPRVSPPVVVPAPPPGETIIIEQPAPPQEEMKSEEEPFLIMLPSATFATNKADLSATGKKELKEAAMKLKEVDYPDIVISGHTDSTGSEEYNQTLSEKRAESVKKYLMSLSVPEETMDAYGSGESTPIASNDTEEGRAENRRVQIELANPE